MSDSVRPHRGSPPGSPIPGILQARTLEWVAISSGMLVSAKKSICNMCVHACSVVSNCLQRQHTRLLCPWDSPGKNTRIGCHFLLQHIFPTQGSNLYFLHLHHPSKEDKVHEKVQMHLIICAKTNTGKKNQIR